MRWSKSALQKFEIGETIRLTIQEDHRRGFASSQTFIGMLRSHGEIQNGIRLTSHSRIRRFWNSSFIVSNETNITTALSIHHSQKHQLRDVFALCYFILSSLESDMVGEYGIF